MEFNNGFAPTGHKRSPIGLTSLIDVVFILLLFFMLTSTFSPLSALKLAPVNTGANEHLPDTEPLVIRVINGDQWRIKSSVVDYAGNSNSHLNQLLQQAIGNQAAVLVHAEATASIQHLVTSLSYLEKQGVKKLNIGESTESSNVE
jgi:biopolymer transport protein ExbD